MPGRVVRGGLGWIEDMVLESSLGLVHDDTLLKLKFANVTDSQVLSIPAATQTSDP